MPVEGAHLAVGTDEELRAHLAENEVDALDKMKALDPELTGRFTDRYLIRFTFARKQDPQRAVELLRNHMHFQEKYNIANFSIERIRPFLDVGITVADPHVRTHDGHPLMFVRAATFGKIPRNQAGTGLDLEGYMMFVLWWVDVMYTYGGLDCYRKGGVVLEDFHGATLMTLISGVPQSDMKEIMGSVQDNVPGRYSAIRLFNTPWWIRIPMKIAMPFLKAKLRKKIGLVSASEMGAYIHPDQLPKDLGGRGPSFRETSDRYAAVHTQLQNGTGPIFI